MALFYNIGSFYYGYTLVYLNTMPFSELYNIFGISMDQDTSEGLLVGCIPLGAAFGGVGMKLV